MPVAFGLGAGMPYLRVATGGGVVVGDAIRMSLTSQGMTQNDVVLPVTKKMYGSMWVSLPAGSGAAYMAIGLNIVDNISLDGYFNYFIGLDPYINPSNFRQELSLNGLISASPEVCNYPSYDFVEQWVNILWEIDTTEALLPNRIKIYIGDVKRPLAAEGDVNLNSDIFDATGNTYNISVRPTSSAAFGHVDAVSKVRAVWVKCSNTSIFDFDNPADRRYFISGTYQYVTHQQVMGGQTADFWGAGGTTGWQGAGWNTNNTDGGVNSGTITSTPWVFVPSTDYTNTHNSQYVFVIDNFM